MNETKQGIRCGRCHLRHDTVADVRKCFNGEQVAATRPTVPAADRATPRQVKFLTSLLRQAEAQLSDGLSADDLSRKPYSPLWISPFIDGLLDHLRSGKDLPKGVEYDPALRSADGDPAGHGDPNEKPIQTFLPDVPEGHYAVPSLTGNNDLDFFRVDRPTEGRYAGRTFVKRVIGGKPDMNVHGKTVQAALTAIVAAGISESAQRYGQEIGRCWRCNRHLTDEESRSLGIGPVCRAIAG